MSNPTPNTTNTISMNQPPPQSPECPICLSEDTKMVTFSCNHSCCSNCWKQIIKAANSNFQVKEIKCFDLKCKKKIENLDELIAQVSDREITQRFQYLQKKQEIHLDKDKFLCPNTNCNKILDKKNQSKVKADYASLNQPGNYNTAVQMKDISNLDYSFMVCDDCSHVFCKVCEVYHEPGKAACKNAKQISSEIIIKVISFMKSV